MGNENETVYDVVLFYKHDIGSVWDTLPSLVDATECIKHVYLTTIRGAKEWDHKATFINEDCTYCEIATDKGTRCAMVVIR